MNRGFTVRIGLRVSALLLAVALPLVALAGPSLVCWPFDIGGARSLPWDGSGWNQSRVDYDNQRLAADTLALLTRETPVLVRMETLRRAAIYSQRDSRVAEQLVTRLQARLRESKAPADAALAMFDLGYLSETYKQVYHNRSVPSGIGSLDGSALIEKALRVRGADSQMEFAAALVAFSAGRPSEATAHLREAAAAAADGSLLARNLVTHAHLFRISATTLAGLRAETARLNR